MLAVSRLSLASAGANSAVIRCHHEGTCAARMRACTLKQERALIDKRGPNMLVCCGADFLGSQRLISCYTSPIISAVQVLLPNSCLWDQGGLTYTVVKIKKITLSIHFLHIYSDATDRPIFNSKCCKYHMILCILHHKNIW